MAFFGDRKRATSGAHGHGAHGHGPPGVPGFFDVARQQAELIQWVGTKIQEHEQRIESIAQEVKTLADRPPRRSSADHSADSVHDRGGRERASTFRPAKWSDRGSMETPEGQNDSKDKAKKRSSSFEPSGHSSSSHANKSHKNRSHSEPRHKKDKRDKKEKRSAADHGDAGVNESHEDQSHKRRSPDLDDAFRDDAILEEDGGADGETATPSRKSRASVNQERARQLRDVPDDDEEENREDLARDDADDSRESRGESRDESRGESRGRGSVKGAGSDHDGDTPGEADGRKQSPSPSPANRGELSADRPRSKQDGSRKTTRDSTELSTVQGDAVSDDGRFTGDAGRFTPDGEYALNVDVDRKMNEFSEFMTLELQRLDNAMVKDMEARMEDAIADAVASLQSKIHSDMKEFETGLSSFVDDKIAESLESLNFGRGETPQGDDLFSAAPMHTNDPRFSVAEMSGAPGPRVPSGNVPQFTEENKHAVGHRAGSPGQPMQEIFTENSSPGSLGQPTPSSATPGAPRTSSHTSDAQTAGQSGSVAADHVELSPRGGPGRASLGGSAAGGAGGAPVFSPMSTPSVAPSPFDAGHVSATPDQEVAHATAGMRSRSLSGASGAFGEAKRRHSVSKPGVSIEDFQAAQSRNEEVTEALRKLHQEVARRLPPLEKALEDLKPLRLQMPTFQSDLDNLQASVSHMAQAMEGMEESSQYRANSLESEGGPGQGQRQFTNEEIDDPALGGHHQENPPPRPAREQEAQSDFMSEDAMSAHDGPLAGAHSLVDTDKERRPSVCSSGRRPSIERGSLDLSIGGSRPSSRPPLAQYMQKNALTAADKEQIDSMSKRLEKLEETADAREKIQDMEQLCTILEDRVRELDTEYHHHIKTIDLKLELLKAADEKTRDSAKQVYDAWNLENQVDVIQSVVAQEMRGVRLELDQTLKSMSAGMSEGGLSGGQGAKRGSVAQLHSGGGAAEPSKSRFSSGGRRSSSRSPERQSIEETEEKVKRLQECYQQCTLKIAGLKSANRHAEQQLAITTEQLKKSTVELEDVSARATKNECRLDYLYVHLRGRKPDDDSKLTYKGTVEAGRNAQILAAMTPRGMLTKSESEKGKESKAPVTPVHKKAAPNMHCGSPTNAELVLHSPEGDPADRRGSLASRRRFSLGKEGSSTKDLSHFDGAGSPGPGLTEEVRDDVNTGRIWRLGKKLTDLETDQADKIKATRDEIELVTQKLNMITGFLPKRLRMMVERLLVVHNKKEDAPQDDNAADRRDGEESSKQADRRRVKFTEKAPDVRTFNVDPESVFSEAGTTWQCVGEPDAKWSWCLQPLNEMGHDLARHFETQEQEWEELEDSVKSQISQLRSEMLMRLQNAASYTPPPMEPVGRSQNYSSNPRDFDREVQSPASPNLSPAMAPSPATWGGMGGPVGNENFDKLVRRVEKMLVPQVESLDDRVNRLVKDITEVKKQQDSDNNKKADKEDVQLVKMRLAVFEKFDPKQVAAQVDHLEVDGKHHLHLIDQLAEQVRKVEGYAAHKADVAKAKAEVGGMRSDLDKIKGDVKETASTVFNSNRQMSTIVLEAKSNLEKLVQKLEMDKVAVNDYAQLVEKVSKLENSMRDNRHILSESGAGAEVNNVVKRIILNMEDKIMILERKIDMILEGRAADAANVYTGDQSPDDFPKRSGSSTNEAAVITMGQELSSITQAVTHLKQEMNISKMSLDHMRTQNVEAAELAQRLNIIVEGPGGDEATTLSLSRVQVMVAAAARQLVAGSKWVTQEIFDQRLAEVRKDMSGLERHMHETSMPRLQITSAGGPKKLPNLADRLPKKAFADQDGPGWAMMSSRPPNTAPAQVNQLGGLQGFDTGRPQTQGSARGSSSRRT